MKGRSNPLLAILLISSMALGFIPLVISSPVGAVVGTPGPATTLSVTSVPSHLPADGQSYPSIVVSLIDASRNPSLALTPTTVYLTSSEEDVGTVPNSLVIPAGKGYAIANFTTTFNPGVTSVTASAPGFATAQTTVNTKTPSGYADRIKVTAAPSSVLPAGTGSLIVQLLDATGEPARAPSTINVTISSSSSSTVRPDAPFLIIPAGSDMGILNFTATYQLGTSVITASASTLISGTAAVQVVGANPYSLSVSVEPNQVVTSSTGTVTVWITGTIGHPAAAAQDTTVTLTSSNTTVVELSSVTIVIKSGQMSASANFSSSATKGTSTITASAQGLQTGFATIQTFKASLKPAGLKVFFAPNPVLADDQTYKAVTISIVNSSGFPDLATSEVTVTLTSASDDVGNVTSSAVIPKGEESATAYFAVSYLVGTTIITASAQNMLSAQASASTYGPIPVGVEVTPTVSGLPANGGKYDALAVSLVDAEDGPAIAPANILVHLTSSLPSVASVNQLVQISAGESSVVTTVDTGITAGTANISATSPGYLASFALLPVVIPAPTILGLFVSPAVAINSTAGAEAVLTVQLQDINGLPAQASAATTVTVISSNQSVVDKPIPLSIPAGGDFISTFVSSSGAGKTNLTASSQGLASASAILDVLTSPTTVTLSASSLIVPVNQSVTISLKATALGAALPNASVRWFTTADKVQPTSSNTSAQGTASTVLVPTVPGAAIVTAEVSSPLIGVINSTVTVAFTPLPTPVKPSFSSQIRPYIIPIVLVVVVVLVAVLVVFLRRRSKARASKEGEVPEEEQPYDELEEAPATEEGTDEGVMSYRMGSPWPSAGVVA